MAIKNYSLAEQAVVNNWDPEWRPVHCSNCLHCKVVEEPRGLMVRCAMGQGKCGQRSYWAVMRRLRPFGFLQASKCPNWSSMSDD